jgi:hypothetical protein
MAGVEAVRNEVAPTPVNWAIFYIMYIIALSDG